MTVHTLVAPMAEIELVGGMKLRLRAVHPTTGAAVTGVTCTAWAIYGLDLSDVLEGPDEVPRLQPYEVEEGELI